jgi:hypothetical protein
MTRDVTACSPVKTGTCFLLAEKKEEYASKAAASYWFFAGFTLQL